MSDIEINETVVQKVLEVVDAGLSFGLGKAIPGQMCVEAAVCFALGEKHSDTPSCVHETVRAFKIALNDKNWSSRKARAKGMRRIAIAQLGSLNINSQLFIKLMQEETIKQIVPIALRAAAKKNPKFSIQLEKVAANCEKLGTVAAVLEAREVASAAAYAAGSARKDKIYSLLAEITVQVLIKCNTEGSKFLSLTEEEDK